MQFLVLDSLNIHGSFQRGQTVHTVIQIKAMPVIICDRSPVQPCGQRPSSGSNWRSLSHVWFLLWFLSYCACTQIAAAHSTVHELLSCSGLQTVLSSDWWVKSRDPQFTGVNGFDRLARWKERELWRVNTQRGPFRANLLLVPRT